MGETWGLEDLPKYKKLNKQEMTLKSISFLTHHSKKDEFAFDLIV